MALEWEVSEHAFSLWSYERFGAEAEELLSELAAARLPSRRGNADAMRSMEVRWRATIGVAAVRAMTATDYQAAAADHACEN